MRILELKASAAVLASTMILLSGCETNSPTVPEPTGGSSVRAAGTIDSSAKVSGAPTAVTTAAVSVISLQRGDKVTVTVISNECSGNPESVNMSGILSGLVASGSCAGGLVGQGRTFGPASADGTISFNATHPSFGTGPAGAVTGASPDYSVGLNDGYGDSDFNDVILRVHVIHDPGTLTCLGPNNIDNTVPRGATATCTVKGTGVVVTKWTLTGPSYDGSITWRVNGPRSGNSWKGPVVMSGDVTAEVTVNGTPRSSPLTARLEVQRRTGPAWSWGKGNNWGYSTVPLGNSPCQLRGSMMYDETSDAGRSFRKNFCDSDVLTPNPRLNEPKGYSVKQVGAGGPNEGIWYVSGINYQMLTWSMINPAIAPGSSSSYALTNQADIDRCKAGAGKTITKANFYFFNKTCAAVKIDAWITKIWNHEGYGCCSGNGHQAQLEIAANEVAHMIYAMDEGMLTLDQDALRQMISSDAKRVNSELNRRWASHANVTGNIPPTEIWQWHSGWKQFFSRFDHD